MIIIVSPTFLEHSVVVAIRTIFTLPSCLICYNFFSEKSCRICNGIHAAFVWTTIKRIYFLVLQNSSTIAESFLPSSVKGLVLSSFQSCSGCAWRTKYTLVIPCLLSLLLGGEIYLAVSRCTFVHLILHIHLISHFCVPRLKFLEPKWSQIYS